jgi:Ca2+-binding RTX toxin-like protein
MKPTRAALLFAGTLLAGTLTLAAPAAAEPGEHPCHPHADPTVIVGSLGNDRLVGTPCANTIYGLPGNDVLVGRAGEDSLLGGRGNDRLRAIDGEADVVRGGAGFDRCRGDRLLDLFVRCEVVVAVSLP